MNKRTPNVKLEPVRDSLELSLKRIEIILQNNAARDYHQQRIETWIFQLADKIGLRLKYD